MATGKESLEPVIEAVLEAAWAHREEAVGRTDPGVRNDLLRRWQTRLELALALLDADTAAGGSLDREALLRAAARRHRLGSRNTLRGGPATPVLADRRAAELIAMRLGRGTQPPPLDRLLRESSAAIEAELQSRTAAGRQGRQGRQRPAHPPLGYVGP